MDLDNLQGLGSYRDKYAYTAYLSRRDWAYEYLRRNQAFEKEAWMSLGQSPRGRIACHNITVLRLKSRQRAAEEWGLRFFPNPEAPAPSADVFWTESAYPDVLRATVVPRSPDESHPLFDETVRKCRMTHLTDEEGVEHLVAYGKGCSVQVCFTGHTLVTTKPVKTFFAVGEFDSLDEQVRILRQSKKVYGDHITEPPVFSRRAIMLRNGLIALDGYRAGLTDRQIAWIIDGHAAVEAGVAKGDRSLINRICYYREKAIALSDGRYRSFLRRDDSVAA